MDETLSTPQEIPRFGAPSPGPGWPDLSDLNRVLLDSMTEGVSLSTEDGAILYANPAEDRMFGYAPGELLGKDISVQSGHLPEVYARLLDEVTGELARSGSWRGDWLGRRKDGSIFTTALRLSVVRIEGRAHWLWVRDDVTARRRAAAELRVTEARLELATEAAALGVWDWDVASGRLTYSARAKAICGFAADQEITYEDARRITHPDDYPRTSAMALRALDPTLRERAPYEYRVVLTDGSIRWVLAHGEAVFEEVNGEVRAARYVGTLQDLTERKSVETALRGSNDRFRAAIEATEGVLWTNDATGRMVGEQPGWAALTGQSFAQYQGFGWAEAVHPEDRQASVAAWLKAVAGRGMFVHEHRVRRRDGDWRLFAVRAIPIMADTGSISEWVGVHTDITEQRRAEAGVRASEARLRAVVDAAPVGLVFADANGRVTGGNAQVERILGHPVLPSENIQAYREWVAFHPDGRRVEGNEYPLARALAGEDRPELEVLYRRGDGRNAWVRFIAAAKHDETGGIIGGVVASLDIDDQRRARDELQRLNTDLERQVIERSRERGLIWRHSLDLLSVIDMTTGAFDAVNPAWSVALGWAAEEIEGRPSGEFVHPEDIGASLAAFDEVRGGNPVLRFENRYRTRDGGWRWLSWVAVPEADKLYSVTRDITHEREQREKLEAAEAARREADALYRAYFENTPEALFLIKVEADGGFVFEQVNPAHEAGLGLKLEDIRGKRVEVCLPPEAAERALAAYRQVIASGAIHQYREDFDVTGEVRFWDTSLAPVWDGEGRIVRLIGSSRDVTPQLVAEEALRQSQKMEAMGQLTGGVAHDFNNLLTPIVASLDMLRRQGLGGEREQRLIAGAAQSADRAKTLVQRLLAFARRQPLQAGPVDIVKLVHGMGDLVASTSGPRIKVVIDAPLDLPPAKADPNQLEMAILNLAVNARDAMPGGGTLTISAGAKRARGDDGSKLRAGDYICLSVTDTGVGMDAETLARAVEPFFSTKGVGQGTGLGLSMVHGLASQLGGALIIDSTPGKGARVELWLPRSPLGVAAAAPALDPATERKMSGTALLVDDEELVRVSTADMLNDLGFQVIEAGSAEEALRLIDSGQKFDLLVTDHLMPGMNGAELAEAMRSRAPELPVLLVSGYADRDGLDPSLPRLAKPFRRDELAKSLGRLMA
jgi:PAS domain S-box-containing protein